MPVSRETPGATAYFGSDLKSISRYVDLLSTWGVERGLLGPREGPRIWERHVLNCAVVVPRVPQRASVADVGSGAGLPGMVWAIARPDLAVTLIEPLLRRATFLSEVVAELGLTNVDVVRARAADVAGTFDVVTARAVADLGKLAGWCLPLVRPGGVMLALKGQSAHEEVEMWTYALHMQGATDIVVSSYGDASMPTTVVEVRR
ncbi:MAG TPA: 16S rRNA (guanine(527)-N(7))-methyltransferase RsmG [Aeromicrobium sp.]|nr:16S rRNA (guanine(527)-N(7))-methyltransferase RsmG [Aeromicrobium sp.]